MMQLLFNIQPANSPRIDLETEAKQQQEARMINKYVSAINGQPSCLIGKYPWEMTRLVWKSTIDPVNKAYQVSINIGEEAAKAYQDRYGYTHNGYAFHPTSISNSRHEVQVAFAFLRGDHVPDEVAREYSKEYWETTYDLSDFKHLPMYVTTAEARLEAVACWERNAKHAEAKIKDQYFNYQSEAELKHHVVCFDRLLSELAHE